ncbi:Uncharacterized membrane protein YgcG, contains a TPM-fold domain [Lachnospiraceae bacterium RM5]|nr:Uncharacterized membrane protein YgcG, contains a TPM-fold domain [Lachnospiraceae bacterium RM5]
MDNVNTGFLAELSRFLKHFKVPFIILACLLVVFIGCKIKNKISPKEPDPNEMYYDSPNEDRVYGDKRVFDYADKLTDSEEEELEEYISAAEKRTCLDIVIVTLNQTLKDYEPEYTAKYTERITPDKYVMVYADKFWEDNKFGYDKPQILDGTTNSGDGVILVDNLYREDETGKIYTWMGTTGKAEERYSSSMISTALDRFYDQVDINYLEACKDFVDKVESDMLLDEFKEDYSEKLDGMRMPYIVALIVMFVYYLINSSKAAGKKTTNEMTYIDNGDLSFPVRRDVFVRKTVTKTYNPPSSSSSSGGGGGGHHSSGGGGSHGGGGHSR